MRMSQKCQGIRFENLPYLLKDLRENGWIIDVFYFYYKQRKYIVVLKIYEEGECRPSEYAKIKLEFIKHDKNESIKGWGDFYEVHFDSVFEFCQFFGVERGKGNRNLFVDFSEKFAQAIPKQKSNVNNDKKLCNIQASRCEADGANAIYCCGVMRNGCKKDGNPKYRTPGNDNKARTLVYSLYEKICADKTISFCFTEDCQKQKTEMEILINFIEKHR